MLLDEENVDLQSKDDKMARNLDKITEDNGYYEQETSALESETITVRRQTCDGTRERNILCQDRDDASLKLAELHRQVNSTQGQVISMEKDLRHVVNFYKQYEGEIEQESTNYSMQLRKNGTVKENVSKMEALLRDQLSVCDSLDREVKLTYESFVGLNDDNCLLEDDLEKYKEIIRVLGKQNDELMTELDKITEQDESVRFILDRKSRIDGLIEKAEVQCERNTIRQQSMQYSTNKR